MAPSTPPPYGRLSSAAAPPMSGGGRQEEVAMPRFMDVHSGFVGATAEQLRAAHARDLEIEGDEGVHFERAWLDSDAGRVFCLSTGPSRDAVARVHERAGHPPGEVYELTVEVS